MDTDLKEQIKRQAECCVAYGPCPVCDPEPGRADCPLCHGGPGVPLEIPAAPEPDPKQHLLEATSGCRGGIYFGLNAAQLAKKKEEDEYNGGCTGCHVDYPKAERPSLPARTRQETLRRILATPMWKGSKVVEVSDPTSPSLVSHCVITHPSGAVFTLRVSNIF